MASASAAPLGLPARTQRRWRIAAISMAAARLATGYTRPRLTTSVRVTAASPAPVRATNRRVCSARANRYIESKPNKKATNTPPHRTAPAPAWTPRLPPRPPPPRKEHANAPVWRVMGVGRAEAPVKDANAPRCLRQRLQKAGAGLEGGACCCQQQHRTCHLKRSEQRARVTDALARSAIWVESGSGTPTWRRTANTVRPSVSHPTTTNLSQSVTRPNMIWEGRSS
jgi:hypothetical protein